MSESSESVVKVIRCIVCPTGCQIQAISKGSDIVFEGYQETAGTDIVLYFKGSGSNLLSIYINEESGY